MSVQELFSMLNEKNVRFDVGSGGIPTMTADDLSAAIGMAKLDRGPYCLLRVKYCADRFLVRELVDLIVGQAMILAVDRSWRKFNGLQQVVGLADLVVWHEIDARRCNPCNGTGLVNQSQVCSTCVGTGISKPMSNRRKAKMIGVDEKAWRATWDSRFNELSMSVSEWEDDAVRRVAKKLFK